MFDNSLAITIGICLIIFIIVILLVIFAPKCQNFFDKSDFPWLDKLSKNEELFLETSVLLNIIESDNLDDASIKKLENIKEKLPYNELKWEKWPNKKDVFGDVSILILKTRDKEIVKECPGSDIKIEQVDKNAKIFSNLLENIYTLNDINQIKSVYFIKLNQNAKFLENKGYADLTNDTLRYIYCFNSYCYDENECGIWVNYDAKKTINGASVIYDASKNHSLYNNTVDTVVYLVIDFKRPDHIPAGYSDLYASRP